MRPILLSIGSLNFYSYGFFTALGFILGGTVINLLAKKKRLVTKKHRDYFVIDGLLISLVSAIITARLAYILVYNLIFRLETFDLTHLIGGGFIFYAGLIAGIAVYRWWLHRHEIAILPWLDVIIVGILAGLSFNEIGGYLNDGMVVHLAGLLGGIALTVFAYILCLTEKRRPGFTFYLNLFLLMLLIFFLGFWQPEKIYWLALTGNQWTSLVGMLAMGIYFTKPSRR